MLVSIITANIIVSLISLIGGVLILKKQLLSKKVIPYLVAFAAGVMLTMVFFDMFPEALEQAEKIGNPTNIFFPAFLGIIISFFIERFVLWFHHHESTHGLKPTVFLITIGDGIHNLIDGVTITATFLTNFNLGIITTIAIAAHETPQEIADFGILINSGLKNFQALAINFLSALTAILGGIAAFYFLQNLKGGLPFLLSFSSGIFIYIAGSDLIPSLHKEHKKQKKWAQVVPFLSGIILMYILIVLLEGKH